ncbi:serine hydrolase [Hyphococcus flavus]|uniref:Serine hydrolase n=1 Tax=Hyphococcus flavus TaxID=1866326 RepID=A0AAF0CBA7_9PROT|nr:serine hydrolase domain-containing protein [Hyphococcus flavus]WDI30430.1 serine hydrolase [Hyphococcus flavus]
MTSVAQADALLEKILDADGGPGVMAAVIKDDALVWSGAAGIADLEHNIPLEHDHKLRIGSVSKPITAVLTLLMAQESELELEADIRNYVPEFTEKQGVVTIHQLASHTAGVRHYDFSNFFEANNVVYHSSLTDALNTFSEEPLLAAPGEKFIYSSLGYNLIGAAIESVADETFSNVLSAQLTSPLNLAGTTVDNSLEIIPNRSGFYTVTMKNPVFPWMNDNEVINTIMRDSSDYYPSGGILSTAEDLARFTYSTFNSNLLHTESREMLVTPVRLNDGSIAALPRGDKSVPYGFGWEIHESSNNEPRYYAHGGETNGAYAFIRYYPDQKLAVAAIANYNMMGREPAFFKVLAAELPQIFLK